MGLLPDRLEREFPALIAVIVSSYAVIVTAALIAILPSQSSTHIAGENAAPACLRPQLPPEFHTQDVMSLEGKANRVIDRSATLLLSTRRR